MRRDGRSIYCQNKIIQVNHKQHLFFEAEVQDLTSTLEAAGFKRNVLQQSVKVGQRPKCRHAAALAFYIEEWAVSQGYKGRCK